jgi:peptidoglycan L-alanyl-D-glutamate endopeptidase CwlK
MVQKVLTFIKAVLTFFAGKKLESTQASIPLKQATETPLPSTSIAVPVVEPSTTEIPVVPTKKPVVVVVPPVDDNSIKKIKELYPPFGEKIFKFVSDAQAQGMLVSVFDGLRSFEKQAELYAKGRTAPGKIVTKAKPGFSYHCYGLAVDLVFDADQVKPGWQWTWDDKYPWKKLSELGVKHGLESAMTWKSFPEAPHYQLTYGFTTAVLNNIYISAGLSGVWKYLDKSLEKLS